VLVFCGEVLTLLQRVTPRVQIPAPVLKGSTGTEKRQRNREPIATILLFSVIFSRAVARKNLAEIPVIARPKSPQHERHRRKKKITKEIPEGVVPFR
jgi:hypothetical protein